MPLLIFVSFIWAFSFGLLSRLKGLDSSFVAAARLGLALVVFLPFLRIRALPAKTIFGLAAIGAVQFGVMYLAYNESFHFLQSHEVALFTLTTPIIVTLLADAFERTLRWRALMAAVLAVLAAALVVAKAAPTAATITGIVLVQVSNLAFALGQVLYRRLRLDPRNAALRDRDGFGLLYAGGFAVALAAMLTHPVSVTLTGTQALVLVYLGAVASGLAFFLWNIGATRVNAGVLAAMNNAKVPLAVAVSLVVFREKADLTRLIEGLGLLILAVWLAERKSRPAVPDQPGS